MFTGNTFAGNTEAIAIEHGQNIQIRGNIFKGDETAIRVWANAAQDPSWGYPRQRDTRSREYVIEANRFEGTKTALNILRTTGVRVKGNAFASVGNALQIGSDVGALEFEPPGPPPVAPELAGPPRLQGAVEARLPDAALRGRSTIIVDEWGPYDYRSPKLWPAGKPDDRPLKLRVLGPPGKWTLKSIRGGTTTAREGVVPGDLTVTLPPRGIDLDVTLEYVGAAVLTPRGQGHAAGARVPVSYTLFEPAVDWTVMFWKVEAPTTTAAAQDRVFGRLQGVADSLGSGAAPRLSHLGADRHGPAERRRRAPGRRHRDPARRRLRDDGDQRRRRARVARRQARRRSLVGARIRRSTACP